MRRHRPPARPHRAAARLELAVLALVLLPLAHAALRPPES
jgi:hypothetical protein